MNENERFIGYVQNGQFRILTPRGAVSGSIRLTEIQMQEAVSPESRELDLREYEDSAIMVRGHESGNWIYSAEVIDRGGPILTAVVMEVFGKNENNRFIGYVQNGQFKILTPGGAFSTSIRLTEIQMQEAVSPESRELDLTEYENSAIMVRGHESGGWIYSAEVIDRVGPILTAVVMEVFGKEC